jgi:hypothetical protein
VLPYPNDGPTHFDQLAVGIAVSGDIGDDLRAPPIGIVLWPSAMVGTTVPETSIDENRRPRSGKCNID